jgi:hypothetical protein
METHSKVFATDFNTAWDAVMDALKSMRLDISNRDRGYIQTRWMDNTADLNFTQSTGIDLPYLKAQYRFKVNVSKWVIDAKEAIKVTLIKEQVAQRDALDHLRQIETDQVDENTMLYRIGRVVYLKMKLSELEKQRNEEAIRKATEGH